MKRHAIAALAIPLGLAADLAAPALACGERQFNMGQGLKYQAYLAPNPAAVLVYDAGMSQASPKRRAALIEGLRASGHTVTEVADDTALARALQAGRFDVVIASYVNFSAVLAMLRAALRGGADIVIICAGRERQFSLEDAACAGRPRGAG